MLSKFKNFIKRNAKPCITSLSVAMLSALSCLTCFAAEGDTVDIKSILSTSISNLQNELLGYLGIIIPVAFVILMAYLGAKKAFSFIRGLIGK